MKSLHRFLFAAVLLALGPAAGGATDAACIQPAPVCDARASVFRISSFDPLASAVRIAPDLLVTNRHSVADEQQVDIFLHDGTTVQGQVVPSAYEGDLVLVRSTGLGDGPVLKRIARDASGDLFTIGADLSRRTVRAYPPGRRLRDIAKPAPFSRLFHTAYSQPGNSGGALVNGAGELVAIVTSGGEGRYEAIPAGEIAKVMAGGGEDAKRRHDEISAAYRECAESLESLSRRRGVVEESRADALVRSCTASRNRQYFDLAAQALARGQRFNRSTAMSMAAIARDPNAINSRLTLAVTLHFAARFREALPHLRILLKALETDPTVHRLAIQAGKWAGDDKLVEEALRLLKKYNPEQAEAAENFLKLNVPAPPRRN